MTETARLPTQSIAKSPGRSVRVKFYYVYVACLLGANAVALMPARNYGGTGNNTLFTASWIVLQGLVVLFVLSTISRAPRNFVFAAATGAFIVSSALWSVAPSSTLLYGGMLAMNILAAHLMASDLDLGEAVTIVGRTILVLCIVGLIAYYLGVVQVYYYDPHGRPNLLGGQPFRGFFVHKITAGLYASLGVVWAMVMLRTRARLGALLVFTWVVLLTSSSTAIALFAFAIVVSLITSGAARRRVSGLSFFLILALAIAAAIAVLVSSWSGILGALGRDETLTGRTDLWQLGIATWSERPVLGWGFAGFFDSSEALSLRQSVAGFANYEIPHFHQSYIQTAVDLGLVGLAILVGIIISILASSYRLSLAETSVAAVAVFSMTAVLVLGSMVMYTFVTYNNLATFALFLFFFALRARRTSPKGVRGGISRSSVR